VSERIGVGGLLFRSLLLGTALVAFGWNLTVFSCLIVCAVAVVFGVFIGQYLANSRLRNWMLLAIGGVCGLGGMWLSNALGTWSWPSEVFGPLLALELCECVRWGGNSFAGIFILRVLAARVSSLRFAEMLVPLLAFASIFSAHRGGNLHRPQGLSDWALERGIDATVLLVALGLVCAICLGLALLHARKKSQIFVGLLLLVGLSLSFYGLFSKVHFSSFVKYLQGRSGNSDPNEDGRKSQMPFQPPKGNKAQKSKAVAVVLFLNEYKPKGRIFYFRQRTHSHYNGIRFIRATRDDVDRDTLRDFPALGVRKKVSSGVPALDKKASKKKSKDKSDDDDDDDDEPFASVKTQVALLRSHTSPFGLLTPLSFKGIPNPNSRVFLRSYLVESTAWQGRLQMDSRLGDGVWSEPLRNYYTQSSQKQTYRELLDNILAPLQKTVHRERRLAKAFMIKYWLERHKVYSSSVRTPKGVRDQISHFLFKVEKGYCVHFAHAAVLLMRMAGVPSRVAEGYAVKIRSRGDSSALIVRAGEAHAWPEIFLKGAGWVPFDIHPQRSLGRNVAIPDPNERRILASLARKRRDKAKKNKPPNELKAPKRPRRRIHLYIPPFVYVLAGIFLALLIVGVYGLKFWRRWAFRWTSEPKKIPYYIRSLEDRLSEMGVQREWGEPLGDFARRLEEKLPALRPFFQWLTARQLGSPSAQRVELVQWIPKIESQFHANYSIVWRAVRFLDPFSWTSHIWMKWRHQPPPAWLRLKERIRLWREWYTTKRQNLFRSKKDKPPKKKKKKKKK